MNQIPPPQQNYENHLPPEPEERKVENILPDDEPNEEPDPDLD